MTRQNLGKLLLSAGLLLLLTAAVLLILNQRESKIAGKNAQTLLIQLDQTVQENLEEAMYDTAVEETSAGQMPQVTLGGYDVVGTVRVPAAGIRLPVLDSWSYDRLKIAPCRYSGSLEGEDLILLGHNYKTHFAPLNKVQKGDVVEFTNVSGKVYCYTVAATEVLTPTQLDTLTDTGYPLTIFTCTRGGGSRFVVRCEKIQ